MNYKKFNKLSIFILLFFFLLLSCDNKKVHPIKLTEEKDSISFWIKYSKNKSYTLKQQKAFLLKAYNNSKTEIDNNTKALNLSSIAYRYYELEDTILFKKINTETQELAVKLKDSFVIADSHWSYADYYFNKNDYTNSYYHFNQAFNYFNGINKNKEAARMLLHIAFIKGRYRDYTGSEVLLIEAIKRFKKLKDNRRLYDSYNDLALLQNDIKEYDRSLFYNEKALEYLDKMKSKKNYYARSLNNIGLTYLEKGDYRKAIDYFNQSLENNKNDLNNYLRALDNRAYSKLQMNDTINVKVDLFRSLFLRDSMKIKGGTLISKIHISDYYKYIGDVNKAIQYAKDANTLASEIKNGRDYLKSLKQLSDLQPEYSKKYLDRYIQYDDSLLNVERKVQNNFNRVQFDTDEYIEDNKRLSQQQIWMSVVGFAILLISSLLYFLRVQKVKTEKLLLETEQQKANEQVYLLTLKQQSILEEEKVKERNRISEELHDGILGRLFGTRVGLGFLDLQGDEEDKQQHQSFLEELQDIEKEIRDVSHKLSDNFNSSEISFTTIIGQLLKDKSSLGSFQSELNIDKNIRWESINQLVKVNVYRIIQESLQNIIKHANAKNVGLDFLMDDKHLVIHLKDDGNGFNTKKSKKGIGMKNMKSRIQKLHGTIDISSEIEKGTSIHIKIPTQ